MSDQEKGALIKVDFGDVSKTANLLIEKISDAIGGYYRPSQIRRIAEAKADAARIRTVSQIETTALQRRALERFVSEEAQKQQNIESVTVKALPDLSDSAKPQDIDNDWITNFFDKCRLVSNDEMQTLWAKVLSGEANQPGGYAKRTVNLLSSLDKTDANLFRELCSFGWAIGDFSPLIFDDNSPLLENHNLSFASLTHLDSIGLATFSGIGGFSRKLLQKRILVSYFGLHVDIEFENETDNVLPAGRVLLTQAGVELSRICGATADPAIFDDTKSRWEKAGLKVRVLNPNWIESLKTQEVIVA